MAIAASVAEVACPPIEQIIPCAGGSVVNGSAPCQACLPSGVPKRFMAHAEGRRHGTKPIYVVLVVPAFSGSSGLEGLLSSSPAVSTMCKHCSWQCEPTNDLIADGAFSQEDSMDPAKTNWTQVYELYYKKGYWDDPTKPLLMDKSPQTIYKVESLVAFYDRMGYDYRFISMARHPCANSMVKDHADEYPDITVQTALTDNAEALRKAQAAADPKRFFTIAYDDLRTRPDLVAKELLSWLPELVSLDIDKSYIHLEVALEALATTDRLSLRSEGTKAYNSDTSDDLGWMHTFDREKPIYQYVTSSACTLHNYLETYNRTELLPWAKCKYCVNKTSDQ